MPRAKMSDEERARHQAESRRRATEKRRAAREAGWEEAHRRMARQRRTFVIRARKHLPTVMRRVIDHHEGRFVLTDESYATQRQWLLNYFNQEKAHDHDIAANLPHLRLVDPTFEAAPQLRLVDATLEETPGDAS